MVAISARPLTQIPAMRMNGWMNVCHGKGCFKEIDSERLSCPVCCLPLPCGNPDHYRILLPLNSGPVLTQSLTVRVHLSLWVFMKHSYFLWDCKWNAYLLDFFTCFFFTDFSLLSQYNRHGDLLHTPSVRCMSKQLPAGTDPRYLEGRLLVPNIYSLLFLTKS